MTRFRANRYLAVSLGTALVLVLLIYYMQDYQIMAQNITERYNGRPHMLPMTETQLPDTDTSNLILAMSLSVYIIVALYSTIFSMRRLKRPGMSAQVRLLFQRKHNGYVFLFIFIWIIKLSNSYYKLFNPDERQNRHHKDEDFDSNFYDDIGKYTKLANYVSLATGILLSAVRFNEPFFRYLVKDFIYSCFGILLQDEKGMQSQTLSAFLASSLNVELVHIILKGIKKFSNIRLDDLESDGHDLEDSSASRTSSIFNAEKEAYQVIRICRLNRIKIKNPQRWDKAQ